MLTLEVHFSLGLEAWESVYLVLLSVPSIETKIFGLDFVCWDLELSGLGIGLVFWALQSRSRLAKLSLLGLEVEKLVLQSRSSYWSWFSWQSISSWNSRSSYYLNLFYNLDLVAELDLVDTIDVVENLDLHDNLDLFYDLDRLLNLYLVQNLNLIRNSDIVGDLDLVHILDILDWQSRYTWLSCSSRLPNCRWPSRSWFTS